MMFILAEADGLGAGDIDNDHAFMDLVVIANETGIGIEDAVDGEQQVTYDRELAGVVQVRLDDLVNTTFEPDYGNGPQQVDVVVIAVPDDFVFGDGSFSVVNNGTALPPMDSGLAGDGLNPTSSCLVLYDTALDVTVARDGTNGVLDLGLPSPVVLYHELSHAFRIVNNMLLALGGGCNPSSPEEEAAIIDENDMRTQLAELLGETPVLRDPGIHCGASGNGGGGSCCIVASLVSGSPRSREVQSLRNVRDGFLRRTATGHEFFEQLHYDYYAFSPQVCGMIAGNISLRSAVLHGFVEPLLDFWDFVNARAQLRAPSDTELGATFVDHVPEPDERVERLECLEQMAASWAAQRSRNDSVPAELFELLRDQAWPRESIQWALVRPLEISHAAMTSLVREDTLEEVGRHLRHELDVWSVAMPITQVWGTLPQEHLLNELAVCNDGLLKTERARHGFQGRLLQEFPDVTAIRGLDHLGIGATI